MPQPPTVVPSSWQRLRKPVAASLGAALLASGAGCMNTPAPKIGGGPAGRNTAAPAQLVPRGATAPANGSKPNIVTIVADDMRTDDLRWMPHVAAAGPGPGPGLPQLLQPLPAVRPGPRSLLTGQYAHNTTSVASSGRTASGPSTTAARRPPR